MKAMRREIEGTDVAAAPVVSEGGRSPSTLSTGLPGMTPDPSTIGRLAPGQRWSVGRKREVVLRLLRGESVELLSRELGVPIYKLEQWREKADAALGGALKERESDPASGELAAAMQRIGEAQYGGRASARQNRASRPFGPHQVAVMAETTSPTTGRRYGVARVCQIWDQPRSSFYAARQPQEGAVGPASATRRCSPPSTPTSSDPCGPAKDTGRSGPGCVRSTACGCHANACCGSWPAVAPSRSHALRRAARSADRHRGAECDVGDRRDPNRHRPGRQGLAVRRRRALERRAARLACRQARDPLRSSSGRRHGGAKPVRPRRRRRRPRPGAAA